MYSRRDKFRAARKVKSANSIPSPLFHCKARELRFGTNLQGHILGVGMIFHHLNLNGQSAASFCKERYFLRSFAAQKILSSTKMV